MEKYTAKQWMGMMKESGYTLNELSPELLQRASDKRMAQADATYDAANKGHFQDKKAMMQAGDKLRDKQTKLYQASGAAANRDARATAAADKETAVQGIGLSPAMRSKMGLGTAPAGQSKPTPPALPSAQGRPTPPPLPGMKPKLPPLPSAQSKPTPPPLPPFPGAKPKLSPLPSAQSKPTPPPLPPFPGAKPKLPQRTMEEWMGMMEESGYTLNELSPELLTRYVDKAKKSAKQGEMKSTETKFSPSGYAQFTKRHAGINKAYGKMGGDPTMKESGLVGKQAKLDANDNGKIDGQDFKMLRAKKGKKLTETGTVKKGNKEEKREFIKGKGVAAGAKPYSSNIDGDKDRSLVRVGRQATAPKSEGVVKKGNKETEETKTCKCGKKFTPTHGEYNRCPQCLAKQHDAAEKATGVQENTVTRLQELAGIKHLNG
jgi:hypothetical protein